MKKLFFFLKILMPIFIILVIVNYKENLKSNHLDINKKYLKIKKNLNINFDNELNKKIKIAIDAYCLKNGGRARQTSILINYLYKIKIFKIYLFTRIIEEDNEYKIPKNIHRIFVKHNFIKLIFKYKIDILIYQINFYNEIKILNKLKNIKVVFYQHSSFFFELYKNFSSFYYLYKEYKNSKYIVSIIKLENDYLFQRWGIKSILMNNFITFDYNSTIPSDLTTKSILMAGSGNKKAKRFNLGMQSMIYIIEEIKESKMIIISNLFGIYDLEFLVNNLNLKNFIEFVGFSLTPEIYFRNSSLHFFTTISESFGLVLCETKIYGIPNILLGLDYVSIAKGGTIIIYDDSPETIAKESIILLKDKKYIKTLGKKARNSMKAFINKLLFNKWIILLLSIYNGDNYYENLRDNAKKIDESEALSLMKNQISLLKIRKKIFKI